MAAGETKVGGEIGYEVGDKMDGDGRQEYPSSAVVTNARQAALAQPFPSLPWPVGTLR
jgi:hypothetical protein